MSRIGFLLVCCVVVLSACSPVRPINGKMPLERDPLEKLNRATFAVNKVADKTVGYPLAKTYEATVPPVMRDRVRDIFQHLREPNNFVNAILQGRLADAGKVAARFAFNTVFGVFGLIDVAECRLDLPYKNYDFGQTLGSWGVKEGPYFVLPLRGPSNFRDTIGRAVDFVMDPFNIIMYKNDKQKWIYAREITEGIDDRFRMLDTLDELQKNSLDYYTGVRSSYHQWRNGKTDNKYSGSYEEAEKEAAM